MGLEAVKNFYGSIRSESARMRRLFNSESDLRLASHTYHIDNNIKEGHTTGWLVNSLGILPNVIDHTVEIEHTFWFGNSYSLEEGIEIRIPVSNEESAQSIVVYRRNISGSSAYTNDPLREVMHDIRIISGATFPEGWRNEFEKSMAMAIQTAYTEKYKTIEYHFDLQ